MDGQGWGDAANDNASGTALVLELVRVFSAADVRTERSIRFALWNNEETDYGGARAYVASAAHGRAGKILLAPAAIRNRNGSDSSSTTCCSSITGCRAPTAPSIPNSARRPTSTSSFNARPRLRSSHKRWPGSSIRRTRCSQRTIP